MPCVPAPMASRMISEVMPEILMSICMGGYAVTGASDLEVHIAVMIFRACDVGKNGVFIAFLHQAHSDACPQSP